MKMLTPVPYQFDRDDEVLALLRRVFGTWIGGKEYFNWKYRDLNLPECSFSRAWIVEQDGKIVAFNGYLPRLVFLEGKPFWAVQSFDTATDPGSQGKGLFRMLQRSAYEEMASAGIKWVYGWTNEISFKVLTKSMNWEIWGEQRYLMKVINAKRFAEEKLDDAISRWIVRAGLFALSRLRKVKVYPGIEIREETTFPEAVSELSMRASKEFEMIADRRTAYLHWRLSKPNEKSRLFCAYSGRNVSGYIVVTRREKCMDIDDCLVDSPSSLSTLLGRVQNLAVVEEADLIRFRVNVDHPWKSVFKRAGFFWSKTSFPLLGLNLLEAVNVIPRSNRLHWTMLDRNE